MLSFGNKEFRNLQEQVLANMRNIQDIMDGTTVLADFGIKVIGQVDESSDLPDPSTYLEEGGEYGDAYVVGTEEPYEYYIFTRAFEGEEEPQWFDLGIFPLPGPQGPQGEQGPIGQTPAISASASAETLSAGQSATAYVSKSGTAENPAFTFTFGIPQGVQGIQGIQGPVGPQGEQGPQGIQGEQGETGYLYTILGQVSNTSLLPSPSTIMRTGAYLVGASEPYDVYIIIGETTADLEWVNIGPIATVLPNIYIASDTYASSGTLSAAVLASITAATDVHYLRDGDVYFQKASTLNGSAYYTSIGIDTGSGATEVGYLVVDLSDGSWEVSANTMPTDVSNYVTTNTAQTITADKTMNGAGIKFTDSSNTNPVTFKLYLDNYNNLIVDRAGQPSYLFATSQLSGMPGGSKDLGSDQYRWNDLYLKNSIQIKNPNSAGAVSLSADAYNGVSFTCNGYSSFLIAPFTSYARGNFCTTGTTYKDLGSTTYKWGDAYLSGGLRLYDSSSTSSYSYKLSENSSGDITLGRTTDGSSFTTIARIDSSGNNYLRSLLPETTEIYSLGTANRKWSDLYLSNSIKFQYPSSSVVPSIAVDQYNRITFNKTSSGTTTTNWLIDNDILHTNSANGGQIGKSNRVLSSVYTSEISDGTNSVTVANIATKSEIPDDTSDLTNGAGYITSSYHDSTKLDASKCTIQTTAPSAAATDGGVHIVYLTSEPSTKYDGYIYLIKE